MKLIGNGWVSNVVRLLSPMASSFSLAAPPLDDQGRDHRWSFVDRGLVDPGGPCLVIAGGCNIQQYDTIRACFYILSPVQMCVCVYI